ncbi:MAG: hypothetical protein E7606_03515 [Ruminococcaceae bacterium]|nr:hypothetical protein [Oscillospiraceae bacterium]
MTKDIVFSPKNLSALLIDRKPCATASLSDGTASVNGTLSLYTTPLGVLVKANFGGLPCDERKHHYRVLFLGKRRRASLPCAPDGDCQCLTASFAVEDILGSKVLLLGDETERPLALGELCAIPV